MSKIQLQSAPLRAVVTLLSLALAGYWAAPRAHAQANPRPPELLTYQGFLADGNGVALATNAPKNYDVVFRIFDGQTGGTSLWAEQQTVTVDKGYFSVLLGEGTAVGTRPPLSTLFTNTTASDRYVEMTVKGIGTGGADVTMLPRLRLLTSPYSFLAAKAISVDGAAVSSGTVPDTRLSGNVALRAGGNTFTGNQIINASVGVNKAPGTTLDVSGGFNVGNAQGSMTFWGFGAAGGTTLLAGLTGLNNNGPQFRFQGAPGGGFTDIGQNASGDFVVEQADVARLTVKTSGEVQVNGANFAIAGGDMVMDNARVLHAKSSSGAVQPFLWPRYSDNKTYINFGSGGFDIRNNNSSTRMYITDSGSVGIGTSTPGATLDVVGTVKASGGITTGSGSSVLTGAAPLIVEEKTPNNQTTWNPHIIDLSPWSNRPGGFKIRIYAQHELASGDYEVRNYEATVVFERAGFANNPQFPSQIHRISFSWTGNHSRQSIKLGLPALNNGSSGYQEIYPDQWFKITNYTPSTSTGGSTGVYYYWTGLNKLIAVTFHPHVSGQIVISDN